MNTLLTLTENITWPGVGLAAVGATCLCVVVWLWTR